MERKPTTDRSITFAVTASLWLLLILLQTLVTPLVSQGIESVFARPSLYYSTWLTDLYLILLFYLNYYSFAPHLMRRRLFRSYLWLLAVSALIGLLIPILCYSLWGLEMPGFAPNTIPLSSLGVIGSVAVIMIGLATRGLLEWDTLGIENKALKQELETLRQEVKELQQTQQTQDTPRPSLPQETLPEQPHEDQI